MNPKSFRSTTLSATPPTGISTPLEALWFDARGNWKRAHEIIQDESGEAAAWVHAYLHRKEGDLDNAAYWYRRARRRVAAGDLDAEWDMIVEALSPDVTQSAGD